MIVSAPPRRSYQQDREWSDRYLSTIRSIVGPLLLEPSPLEVDTAEATDLMILRARDLRVACRVRTPGYAQRYPFQITIRSRRDSGAKTEWEKLVNGLGDWMFYGHAESRDTTKVNPWWVIDLHAWRSQLIRNPGLIRTDEVPNGDGTYFRFYDLRSFAPDPRVVIKASPGAEVEKAA